MIATGYWQLLPRHWLQQGVWCCTKHFLAIALLCCFVTNIDWYFSNAETLFLCLKDRVVDDLNPVLNFTRKEVESLLHFVEEEPEAEKILLESLAVYEPVISQACQLYPRLISKVLLQ